MRVLVQIALLAGLAALLVVMFLDSFRSMVEMWQLSSYNHGYLIPLISAYILITERHRLTGIDWTGSVLGMAALVGAVLLWLVGRGAALQAFEHLALTSMLIAFIWAVAGNRLFFAAWFPLLYLYLATPVGDSLVPVLQRVTADVAVAALNLFAVPAFRDGLYISLPGGDFEVARACSGYRYLNAGVAMAVLIAYLVLSSAWLRIGFVALIGALFVIVNGVRAFLVMIIASASDMRLMTGEDHVWFGYVLFLGIAGFAYWLARWLAEGAQSRRREA